MTLRTSPGYSAKRVAPPTRHCPWLLPAVPKAELVITALDKADDRARDPSEEPEPIPTGTPSVEATDQPGSTFAVALATAGGIGFLPLAPGTFGALLGVILFLGMPRMGTGLYLLSVAALCALGVWASDMAERRFGKSDDGRIVIDEVVGQLLALTPLVVLSGIDALALRPQWTANPDQGAIVWFSLVVTAFVAFRVLDISKPGAVGWAERRFKGGVGVMVDDVVAGVLAAVVVTVPAYVAVIHRLQSSAGLPG